MGRLNVSYKDVGYSIVDDDTSHACLWHDFLHNCSEGKFATALSILFGNCVEKMGEKLINTTGETD